MTNVATNNSELWLQVPGFPDLSLTGANVDDAGHTFTITAVAAGSGGDETSWDLPQPVDTAVQRWMTDGAVAQTQGHENRSPFVNVIVSADTAADLAAGEAALALRSNQTASLLWIPPSGRAEIEPTVFEVWTWHLEHTFDEMQERWLERSYGMRFTAKPWTRSNDLTTVTAVTTSSGPTTIEIDDCSTHTNWTGSPSTPVVVLGSKLEETTTNSAGSFRTMSVSMTRTASVTGLGATPYLAIDLFLVGGGYPTLKVSVDSTALTLVSTVGSVHYYQFPAGLSSFTTLDIAFSASVGPGASLQMQVADVSASDTVGGTGSTKQLTRSLTVGGSVKTSGSVQVASPDTTGLGQVLVYTFGQSNAGYSPPMRQYRTSGNTITADTTAVSGDRELLVSSGTPSGSVTFTVPATHYAEGTYAVLGRFYATAATTLTATVAAALSGSSMSASISGTVTWTIPNSYAWSVLGVLPLPTQPVPDNSTASLVVTLSGTGSQTIYYDELWLLDMTRGTVSIINCGTSQRLWIDAPDADPSRNRPAIYVGNAADRSDAVGVSSSQILSIGDHALDPNGATLFTVTDGVSNAAVSASFYRRWHTHAGA